MRLFSQLLCLMIALAIVLFAGNTETKATDTFAPAVKFNTCNGPECLQNQGVNLGQAIQSPQHTFVSHGGSFQQRVLVQQVPAHQQRQVVVQQVPVHQQRVIVQQVPVRQQRVIVQQVPVRQQKVIVQQVPVHQQRVLVQANNHHSGVFSRSRTVTRSRGFGLFRRFR